MKTEPEDQIVSHKNNFKMNHIQQKENRYYQIIEVMLTLMHLGRKFSVLETVT